MYNRHAKSEGTNIWEIIDFIKLQLSWIYKNISKCNLDNSTLNEFREKSEKGRNICKSCDKEILDYMQTMEYLA